jgi:hypothetical protein
MIVEAKGEGAGLSSGADKGDQMDARWVTNTVEAMNPKTPEETKLKQYMLAALKGEAGAPKLTGKVIGIKKGVTGEQPLPAWGDYPPGGDYGGTYKK